SANDGRTWSKPYVIEDAPGGYCYTAIHFEWDYVLLAYCAGTFGDGSILSRLRIKQISFSDLGL
ncbi:MAG: exo-alpha-sialidase, partial [Lentisphaerae bacterium]|nr:exo-alpha-sialidase [Lentisphaerota bacterium]